MRPAAAAVGLGDGLVKVLDADAYDPRMYCATSSLVSANQLQLSLLFT